MFINLPATKECSVQISGMLEETQQFSRQQEKGSETVGDKGQTAAEVMQNSLSFLNQQLQEERGRENSKNLVQCSA